MNMKRFGQLWIGSTHGVTVNAFKVGGTWVAKADHPWAGGVIFTQHHKTKASAVAYVQRELEAIFTK